MKKIILPRLNEFQFGQVLAAILMIELPSWGQQACTPDSQYTNPATDAGVYPDTIVNLAPAYVGTPYSQTLTIVVPPDTTIFPLPPIPWDSTVLTSASGLPPGFSYSCWNQNGFGNPNRCMWKGNSIGCAVITGTPTIADTGVHNLLFYTDNYLGGQTSPNPYTIIGYKLIVYNNTAINENPRIQNLLQNTPNPFNEKSEILFTTEENGVVKLKIYNMIGTVIKEESIKVKKGVNRIELSANDFESGIYFYSVTDKNSTFTRKMIVKK